MDEEWQLWVKVGIRQLVSVDGPGSKMVGQRCSSTFTPPLTGAWHQSVPIQVAPLENRFFSNIEASVNTPSPALWNSDFEFDLEQSGSDLLRDIGWSSIEGNPVPPDTPVRYWQHRPIHLSKIPDCGLTLFVVIPCVLYRPNWMFPKPVPSW